MKITRGGGHYLSSGVTRNVDISVSTVTNRHVSVASFAIAFIACVKQQNRLSPRTFVRPEGFNIRMERSIWQARDVVTGLRR